MGTPRPRAHTTEWFDDVLRATARRTGRGRSLTRDEAARRTAAAVAKLDWHWPYWLERQLRPTHAAFVPIGEVAEMLYGVRVPAGKGIAGFVFSSGQPMAVADVGEESSFYAEIDKKTGYSTQTILATPLRHSGEIIGVLEYVNRTGMPPFEPFSPEEMDKAAFYGEAIASLVNAYESAKVLRELGDEVLSGDQKEGLIELREWLGNLRDSAEHREMMDLAILLREIAGRGKPEREMCRGVLEAILGFSDSKSETSFLG